MRERAGTERLVADGLVVVGISHLALGLWMAVSPGTFFDFAAFGVRNDHFIRDISTLYLALGAVLLIAARRPPWRVPILAFATVQYALHLANHLADVGRGHPSWVGPANAAGVALGTLTFGLLWWGSTREEVRS
jgi:hypothetical protein